MMERSITLGGNDHAPHNRAATVCRAALNHSKLSFLSHGLCEYSYGLVVLVVSVILGPTLVPLSGASTCGLLACVVRGPRGLADVINNVLLFVPLGAALALALGPGIRAVVVASGVSVVVELAQVFIPGRSSTAADLLFNASGAVLGILLIRAAPR